MSNKTDRAERAECAEISWQVVQQQLERGEDICDITGKAIDQCDKATCLAIIDHFDELNDYDKVVDMLMTCHDPDIDCRIAYTGYRLNEFIERDDLTYRMVTYIIAGIKRSNVSIDLNKFAHILLSTDHADCVHYDMIDAGIVPDGILSENVPYWLRIDIARHCSKTRQSHILDALIYDDNADVRAAVAERGHGLDTLINDSAAVVREAVARQRYGLEKLANDKNKTVRAAVAEQGYGLDKLCDDPTSVVREAADTAIVYRFYGADNLSDEQSAALDQWMAENKRAVKAIVDRSVGAKFELVLHDVALDKLIYDDNMSVRLMIAREKKDYGRDILANDENPMIREIIAKQGFCLEKLVHDKDPNVRKAVLAHKFGLDILIDDEDPAIRAGVAKLGYGLSVLVKDEDEDVRNAVLDHGYGIEILIKHKDAETRRKVAEVCDTKYLKILINDDDPLVRREVAKRGHHLDKLITDKDWNVRAIVASKGYGLDKLIHDKSAWVRVAVALHGYETEYLLKDKSPSVVKAALAAKHARACGQGVIQPGSLVDYYKSYTIVQLASEKSILPDFGSAY